jgi:NAD(P)-dependent dehydrogenase (short-subunit alcohol dehydrogenase family)
MLEDKTVIITGASSGIGAASAKLFARNGANLVLGARRGELLEKVARIVREEGGRVIIEAGDVRDARYAARLVERAEHEFGGLDAAFNNAGTTGALGPIAEMEAANWHEVLATNLTSAFHCAQSQVPALKRRGGGSIVFTSSFVGYTAGLPGLGAYAAAKAGLIGLSQVLAVEHGTDGIRVNALLPGGTKTEMAGDDPEYHEFVAGLHALKRMAEPEEIARAALFLVSDQSSFATGSAMIVDGGNSVSKF